MMMRRQMASRRRQTKREPSEFREFDRGGNPWCIRKRKAPPAPQSEAEPGGYIQQIRSGHPHAFL